MSEDPNAAAAAAGDTPAASDAQVTDGAADATLSSMVDGEAAAAAGPATWPDNWRETLAGSDEKELARLKRFSSIENVYKSYRQAEKRLSERSAAPTLPENATEEQVAEYRKAIGVPETPDGYGLKFSEELKPTEADNEILGGFLADMHRQHMPPAAAKAAFEWYQAQVGRMREEQAAAQQRRGHANQVTLRKEMGADYVRNLGLADEFLAGYPGLAKLVSPTSEIDVLRDVVKLARASADEEALYGGDGHGGGKSLDDKIVDYQNRRVSGEKLTDREYADYENLVAQQLQRNGRRKARA